MKLQYSQKYWGNLTLKTKVLFVGSLYHSFLCKMLNANHSLDNKTYTSQTFLLHGCLLLDAMAPHILKYSCFLSATKMKIATQPWPCSTALASKWNMSMSWMKKKMVDTTSVIVIVDKKKKLFTLCIWEQCAWNESNKRMECFSCTMLYIQCSAVFALTLKNRLKLP